MFTRGTVINPLELRSAFVKKPLVVSPDTKVIDAIIQMSSLRARCRNTQNVDRQHTDLHQETRSSCVLVVENEQVVGILTERDLVRFLAEQQPLECLVIEEVMAHPVITLRESAFTDLFFAINLLQQYHIRHLPILDDQDCLVGIITHESLRQISRPIDLLRLRLVKEVMTAQVICAKPDCSMLEIAQLMADHHISSVVIVQTRIRFGKTLQIPMGILTERDLVQFQALGLNLNNYRAEALMSQPIFAVSPEESLWTVQQIMEKQFIQRVVVTGKQGELLGILTQSNLIQALNPLELYHLAEMLEAKVSYLESERRALLESRAAKLEQEVKAQTVALRNRVEREKLLTQLSTQIISPLSLQGILDLTVEQVRILLGCDRVNIWQFEPDCQSMIVAESTDSSLSLVGERIDNRYFKDNQVEIYRQEKICLISDIYTIEMSDSHRQMLSHLQVRAKISIPLRCGKRLWGLLNVSESQHARDWQPEEVELLQALSVQLAIALQKVTTHQQLRQELSRREQTETRLRESEQRYSTLVAAVPVGIFRADLVGNCIYVNERYCQITGLSPQTARGKGWQQGVHPDDRQRVASEWAQFIQEHCPRCLEYRLQRPDSSLAWVYGQLIAERDADGQVIGYVGTITDISDRKRAEEKIQQYTAQLESSNQELEAFAYSVSHDLRAPLRAIDGFSKALLEDYGDTFNQEGQDYFERIRKNVKRMSILIDDLLRLSRVSRSEIRYTRINLSALAQELLNDLQASEPERNVEWVIVPKAIVCADATLMRVVLTNLLGNAWKFTSHRPTAQIEFGIISQNAEEIYFVQDNGAGFDMNYAKILFGVFQRLHSSDEFPGTGIGLATVQRAIHRHGGRIWAEGAIEQGATFYFTLSQIDKGR